MKKIIIKNLETQDFKGIGTQSFNFSDGRIQIKGMNGAGKTSIAEALIYTLLDTGLSNDKVANEPLTKAGKAKDDYIQNLKLVFEITGAVEDGENGLHTVEKTIIKNKVTKMMFDGVPFTLGKDFRTHILGIMGLTKMDLLILTNPKFLNVYIKNKEAREYIVSLVNNKSDIESVDEYISATESNWNVDFINLVKVNISKGINIFDQIELKTQEVKTSKRQIEDLDIKIQSKQESLDKITEAVDATKDVTALIAERDSLQIRINSVHEENNKLFQKQLAYNNIETEIKKYDSLINKGVTSIQVHKNTIKTNVNHISSLEVDFKTLNMQPLNDKCIVCGSITDQTKEKSKLHKQSKLDEIEAKIIKIKQENNTIESIIKTEEETFSANVKLRDKSSFELGQMSYDDKVVSVTELQTRLNSLNSSIGNNDSIKSIADEIEKSNEERIKINSIYDTFSFELKTLQNIFANQAKNIQNEINGNLNGYTLKLFDIRKNGNIKDIYSIEKDGVDYAKMNNASQINAGLEMINYISKLKNVSVFRIVDNAESVNKLVATESQSFELYVTDKPLEVK